MSEAIHQLPPTGASFPRPGMAVGDGAERGVTPIAPLPSPIRAKTALYKKRRCKECGEMFQPRTLQQHFCTSKHRQDWNNRRLLRGMQLYDLAYEWRAKRLPGGFTRLCQVISDWLAEDRGRRREQAAARELRRAAAKEAWI